MIITIDGPAGSGKSTAARLLAGSLGIAFLDSGATYRAVTLRALRAGSDMHSVDALLDHAKNIDLKMTPTPDGVRVEMDGLDVSTDIRSEEVSAAACHAANSPAVREVLVELQRKMGGQMGDFVTEGRDQGSVVFPQADFKFYLDADPAKRARRRCDELTGRGEQADYQAVLGAIIQRDRSDSTRSTGPLCAAGDAVHIDTTNLTIEQVLAELCQRVETKA